MPGSDDKLRDSVARLRERANNAARVWTTATCDTEDILALCGLLEERDKLQAERKVIDDSLVAIQTYCKSCNDSGLREMVQGQLDNLPWLLEDFERFVADTETLMVTIEELEKTEAERDKLQAIIDQHNLCHDLHGKVGVDDFAAGCAAEIKRIYGRCPWEDRIAELEARP